MKQGCLLFVGFLIFLLKDQQAGAWVRQTALTTPSPSSYIRAPGGTAKVSKVSQFRLRRRCFLPHASPRDGEGAGGAASPTQKKPVPDEPASKSSNDNNDILTIARIIIENYKNDNAMIKMVDDKHDKALGEWLDKKEREV